MVVLSLSWLRGPGGGTERGPSAAALCLGEAHGEPLQVLKTERNDDVKGEKEDSTYL